MTNDEFKRKRLVDSMKSKDEDCSKKTKYESTLPKDKRFEHFVHLKNAKGKETKKWFLLSMQWYRYFKLHCKGEIDRISSIDNSELFDHNLKLKKELLAEKDYIVLPESAWNCLVNWYGIKDEIYVVMRRAYCFKVYRLHQKSNQCQTFYLHYESTIHDFYKALVSALKITTPITHVWLLSRPIRYDTFITKTTLEPITEKVIDPLALSTDSYLSEHLPSNGERICYLAIKTDNMASLSPEGLNGLKNLGNTCYMNSAIQCLSNTPLLTKWFLSDMYRDDINILNTFGLKGELAISYADLLKSIWSSKNITVSPFMFKKTFEKFNSHFTGYEQQDSQEFLGFLLDGLHEDMNRISDKPYIEIEDFEDESQADKVANHFWNYHKARNDSIIVDLFQGQFKSKLICNQCEKVSITFDPFMHLSLPIPISNCKLNITFIYYSKKQTKFTLYLNKDSTIADLNQAIVDKLKDVEHFLIVQLWQQKIRKVFKQHDVLSEISSIDIIYAYELPCSPNDNDQWTIFPVYCKLLNSEGNHSNTFGYPLILALKKSDKDLAALVFHHIQRFAKRDLQEEHEPFTLCLFNSKHTVDDNFPLFYQAGDIDLQNEQEPETIRQGQGLFIKWTLSKAFQAFGSVQKKNSNSRIVNTELWKKFTVIPTVHPKQEDITLTDCLKEFTKEEQLSKDDLWYCSRCKLRQRATKKFDIWRLPEVMVIHLKRFSQVRMWGNKMDAYVDFPITELNMTDYVLGPKDNQLIYDLYAIDNHYGGLGGGHYTACAQNPQDKHWYNFDDSSVNRLNLEKLRTNAAYLLFYVRRRN